MFRSRLGHRYKRLRVRAHGGWPCVTACLRMTSITAAREPLNAGSPVARRSAAARKRVRLETTLRGVDAAAHQVCEREAAGELVADGGGDFFIAGAEERVAQVSARFR